MDEKRKRLWVLGALAALAVPLAVAATAFACFTTEVHHLGDLDHPIIIGAAPQRVEWGDDTARFEAQITVRPEGQATGDIMIIVIGPGEEEKWFLRVEEGSGEVDPTTGKVKEVVVVGAALDADGRPHGRFRARVIPTSADGSTDRDCLIFDIDGPAFSERRVVAEGTMRVLGGRADDGERAR